jgi:DNA-binding transcriptional ArsR family regulator
VALPGCGARDMAFGVTIQGSSPKVPEDMARLQELLAGLRAAGEETRLRLLFILSRGEFNVSELTAILGRASRASAVT